jgi:membrane protein YdbS with pleckstrin-like domain
MQVDSLIIRRSPAILVYRIVWMTMFFYAATAIAYPVAARIWIEAGLADAFIHRFVWSLLTISAESCIIILLFIHWSMTTYEIRPGELVYRSGFLMRKMDIHSLKNMQTVYISQGVLGRLFRYGTVRLYNPMSKEELLLEHISDPERYAESLRQVLDMPSGGTILRNKAR